MYRPIKVQQIKPPKEQSFVISSFRGVDFRRGDYITDNRRSPDAVNTVWGVTPEVFDTRIGVKRVLGQKITDNGEPLAINGIHIYEHINEILIHAGQCIYKVNQTSEEDIAAGGCTVTQLMTGIASTLSQSFMFEGKLYIIGCGKYLVYDGVTVEPVENKAFIPTTVIGRAPIGGGTPFEAVNLLSKWRKNSFYAKHNPVLKTDTFGGDGTTKEFTLTNTHFTNDLWDITVNGTIVVPAEDRVNGKITFDNAPVTGTDNIVVKYYTEDRDNLVWETQYLLDSTNIDEDEVTAIINGITLEEDTDFTVNRTTGKVTFNTAPTSDLEGVDSIIITFAKTVDGYADQINKCSIFGIFGGQNDSRIFLSGNPETPNKDWASGLYDATYFPDRGFTYVGIDSVAIKGYVKQYDTLMVIKESTQMDSSAYLRKFTLDNNDTAVFPIEQGAVGIGAASSRSFAYMQGQPIFLSKQGVMSIIGTNVDNQRLMQDASSLINSVLTQENGLDNGVGLEFDNKYFLFINGKVFVADCRMQYNDDLGRTQYEWMYWNNINATSANVHTIDKKSYLLFGHNGMLFRFKRLDEIKPYVDEDENGNERNIESYWTTPKLYLGAINVKKTLRNVYFLFSKRNRINVRVEAVIDNSRTVDLGTYIQAGVLDFTDIDFNNFTFLTSLPTYTYSQNAMITRLDNMQLKLSKVNSNEITSNSFGIEAIQTTYELMNN